MPSTFAIGQTYLTADKIVKLVKGLSVGVMVTGNGNIDSESVATLLKDLRRRLDGSTGSQACFSANSSDECTVELTGRQ